MPAWKKSLRQWITFVIGALLLYNGLAFMVLADVGVAPFDAMTLTITHVFSLPFGTAFVIMNMSVFLINLAVLNKKFPPREFAQLILIFGGGFVLNFLTETLYADLVFPAYWVRLVVFAVMVVVTALGCLFIIEAKLMTTPLESLCGSIGDRIGWPLGIVRWVADGVFIITAFSVQWGLHLPLAISVGTFIGLALFGPTLHFLKNPIKRLIRFLHLSIA